MTEIRSAQDCYFTNEETAACAEEAHKLGKRLCAHARARDSVTMCVRHGIDVIYHASYIDEEGKSASPARHASLSCMTSQSQKRDEKIAAATRSPARYSPRSNKQDNNVHWHATSPLIHLFLRAMQNLHLCKCFISAPALYLCQLYSFACLPLCLLHLCGFLSSLY